MPLRRWSDARPARVSRSLSGSTYVPLASGASSGSLRSSTAKPVPISNRPGSVVWWAGAVDATIRRIRSERKESLRSEGKSTVTDEQARRDPARKRGLQKAGLRQCRARVRCGLREPTLQRVLLVETTAKACSLASSSCAASTNAISVSRGNARRHPAGPSDTLPRVSCSVGRRAHNARPSRRFQRTESSQPA